MTSFQNTPQYFLSIAHLFKLGCLETEQQHPHTKDLSDLVRTDLPAAINKIKDLDINVIQTLITKVDKLQLLNTQINDTLKTGGKIFICGCGATGRLSLVLETLWRQECLQQNLQAYKDSVISFMAGGDAALIKSIQDFEDHPQFAQQQLIELNFGENDLLIGSTQGGQTSWVIGAIWKATQISKRKPYILYGNSDSVLIENVQRSKKFIKSELINNINMNVGHMAIAGSTRMQSTTILMYGIGLCLLGCNLMREYRKQIQSWKQYFHFNTNTFLQYITKTDFTQIQQLIKYESNLYKNNKLVSYKTSSYYAISILTDTTQRAPTFSLSPFQNIQDKDKTRPSWCNIVLSDNQIIYNSNHLEQKIKSDWQHMLGNRNIRSLDSQYWKKYSEKVSLQRIVGFPFNKERQNLITVQYPFKFTTSSNITVQFPDLPTTCRLSHHLILKIIMNNYSTLIMGLMGRYSSNVMTYVRPTNYKLIDRAARCIMMLKSNLQYAQVIRTIYLLKDKIREDEPIVLRVLEYFENIDKNI